MVFITEVSNLCPKPGVMPLDHNKFVQMKFGKTDRLSCMNVMQFSDQNVKGQGHWLMVMTSSDVN